MIPQRYDNVLLVLPTLKKHQRRNKDGSVIHIPDPEQGDRWTSLENELYQWTRELDQQEDKETKNIAKVELPGLKIR